MFLIRYCMWGLCCALPLNTGWVRYTVVDYPLGQQGRAQGPRPIGGPRKNGRPVPRPTLPACLVLLPGNRGRPHAMTPLPSRSNRWAEWSKPPRCDPISLAGLGRGGRWMAGWVWRQNGWGGAPTWSGPVPHKTVIHLWTYSAINNP